MGGGGEGGVFVTVGSEGGEENAVAGGACLVYLWYRRVPITPQGPSGLTSTNRLVFL